MEKVNMVVFDLNEFSNFKYSKINYILSNQKSSNCELYEIRCRLRSRKHLCNSKMIFKNWKLINTSKHSKNCERILLHQYNAISYFYSKNTELLANHISEIYNLGKQFVNQYFQSLTSLYRKNVKTENDLEINKFINSFFKKITEIDNINNGIINIQKNDFLDLKENNVKMTKDYNFNDEDNFENFNIIMENNSNKIQNDELKSKFYKIESKESFENQNKINFFKRLDIYPYLRIKEFYLFEKSMRTDFHSKLNMILNENNLTMKIYNNTHNIHKDEFMFDNQNYNLNRLINICKTVCSSIIKESDTILGLFNYCNYNNNRRDMIVKDKKDDFEVDYDIYENLCGGTGSLNANMFINVILFLSNITSSTEYLTAFYENKKLLNYSYNLDNSSYFLDLGSGTGIPTILTNIMCGCYCDGYELKEEDVKFSIYSKYNLLLEAVSNTFNFINKDDVENIMEQYDEFYNFKFNESDFIANELLKSLPFIVYKNHKEFDIEKIQFYQKTFLMN